MNTFTQKLERAGLWLCLVLASIILVASLVMLFHVSPAIKLPIILGVVVMDTLVIANGIIRGFRRKA